MARPRTTGHDLSPRLTARLRTPGTHTLKLVVVGTSGRPRVVVDAYEVVR